MSTDSGAANGSTALKEHTEYIYLGEFERQTDTDGRYFYTGAFVSTPAHSSLHRRIRLYTGAFVSTPAGKNRYWKWTLVRSGSLKFNLCVEPLSDHLITLSSVVLHGDDSSSPRWYRLMKKQNIGQSNYQSGDFSIDTNCLPRFDEKFIDNGKGIELRIQFKWIEAEVNAVPLNSDGVLEGLYAKVMDGGDTVYELMSSDGQPFSVNIAILEAKSAYFKRFFATDGWKEQTEGRMVLVWTSAVVKQLIRYVYLNKVDGDVCELLPDVLDAAQMWELIGMKSVIEWQMQQRLQKATRDADTDTAAEYLKMAHLHSLTSLVPICNDVLAENYDKFYDSECCKQMFISSEFSHLVKAVFHHKRNTNN